MFRTKGPWQINGKEDLMLHRKPIVKLIGLFTAAFLIFTTIPISTSYAAISNQVAAGSGWVHQIFQKVWQQVKKTEKSKNNKNKTETPPKGDGNTGGNSKGDQNSGSNNGGQNGNEDQSNESLADQIIKTGEKYLGTPYQYGAPSGQTRTFDCSSFTQFVYKQHGINLPRSSKQQAQVGVTVPRSQIKKGDLLFFKTSKSNGQIGHVAIYAGNNRVLHTWGPGGVRYDSLSTAWLDKGYITAKRVIK